MTQATMERIRTEYNKLVGRIDGEYYYLRYTFDDGDMMGVVGSILRPVTTREADDRRDNFDDDNELWKQAVDNDETTLGADDWHNSQDYDDDYIFDLSDRALAGNLFDFLKDEYHNANSSFDIELIECIGGGRCFDSKFTWDELYNPNLWSIIKQYESKNG